MEIIGELAAVMAEEGRMTKLKASGKIPTTLVQRELTRGMANRFTRGHHSYVADMEYRGVVVGVTQRTVPIGQLFNASQR